MIFVLKGTVEFLKLFWNGWRAKKADYNERQLNEKQNTIME